MITDENRLQVKANLSASLPAECSLEKPANHKRPSVWVDGAQLERAKKRIETLNWARSAADTLYVRADSWLGRDLSIPLLGGGHPIWFVAEDGSPLRYDPDRSDEHYSPSDGRTYRGEQVDSGWRFYRHNEIVSALRDLTLAYLLSGRTDFAKKAKSILCGYAECYPNYILQDRGGRMYWQTLDESVSLVEISLAYDWLYDSGIFSEQEKRDIEINLLRASAITVSRYDMGYSNWNAWHMAAIGMAGFALGDRTMMEFAINGEHGFEFLMREGVLDDGFWWEGAMAYHMYALAPLNMLAEGAKRWGYDLYGHPALKSMFDAPIAYAYPDLSFPVNNDGGRYGISLLGVDQPEGQYDYEAAYAHYGDTLYGALLRHKYESAGIPRAGRFALLLGADTIPATELAEQEGRVFGDVGHAILRSGIGDDANFALLDYGPHGGDHGHNDKLHLDLFGAGTALAPDFGTPGYGHPLYRNWYRQTISHNTILVDGKSQSQCEGELPMYISSCPDFRIMQAVTDQAYPNVHLDRTVWMHDGYILDWFEAISESGQERQFDWILHGLGEFSADLPFTPHGEPLGSEDGYSLLKGLKSAYTDGGFAAEWQQPSRGAGLRLNSLPFGGREVVVAEGPGPGNEPDRTVPLLIQRMNGQKAVFVSVLQPFRDASRELYVHKTGERQFLVRLDDRFEHLYYRNDADSSVSVRMVAAKAVTVGAEPFHFEECIIYGIDTERNTLDITLVKSLAVQSVSMLFHSPPMTRTRVNGGTIEPVRFGEYWMIRMDAKDGFIPHNESEESLA